jgi:hypothetical protein
MKVDAVRRQAPRPGRQAHATSGGRVGERRSQFRGNYLPGNALAQAHFGQRVNLLLSFALHLLQRRLRSFFL